MPTGVSSNSYRGQISSRTAQQQHQSSGRTAAGAAAVSHHAPSRLPLAQQSGQESPVVHEEGRRYNISQADLLREQQLQVAAAEQ